MHKQTQRTQRHLDLFHVRSKGESSAFPTSYRVNRPRYLSTDSYKLTPFSTSTVTIAPPSSTLQPGINTRKYKSGGSLRRDGHTDRMQKEGPRAGPKRRQPQDPDRGKRWDVGRIDAWLERPSPTPTSFPSAKQDLPHSPGPVCTQKQSKRRKQAKDQR